MRAKRPKSGKLQLKIVASNVEPLARSPLTSKSLRITDVVLARAKARRRKTLDLKGIGDPFTPAVHPPMATPPKRHQMAMDDGIAATVQWAGSFYGAAFTEGVTFLGYTYLAELAQRPEYRVISSTIAEDCTRKWIALQASSEGEDKSAKIKEITEELSNLKACDVFRAMIEQDGFFGRSHLYIDTGATDDPAELKTSIGNGRDKTSKAKIKKGSLKRISTVEAVWVYPTNYNSNNPLKNDWYNPNTWFSMGTEIHASRLLKMVGREVPDLLKPAYSFGGLSMSQMAKPYVDNWLQTRQAVNNLIHTFSVSGLKSNLQETLSADGDQMFKRADLFNATRDNQGLLLIDKETEEFFNVTTPLGTLDALQAQAQEHMASVSKIPLVKLLGISPAGLNASSEGEIETYDDNILAYQEKVLREPITRLIGFIQLSKYGEVDPEITFKFEPLRSLDEKELAETEKIKSETDTINIDNGTIDPSEARQRIANDPSTPYQGLDLTKTIERPEDIDETGIDPFNNVEQSEEHQDDPGAAI